MAYPTHQEARDNGWFSRRHETDEANRDARKNYQTNRGRKARQRKAAERKGA